MRIVFELFYFMVCCLTISLTTLSVIHDDVTSSHETCDKVVVSMIYDQYLIKYGSIDIVMYIFYYCHTI